MLPYNTIDVAVYLARLHRGQHIYATGYRVNIMLYFCYTTFTKFRHYDLVDEQPEAWEVGPVFPSVVSFLGPNLDARVLMRLMWYKYHDSDFLNRLAHRKDEAYLKSQYSYLKMHSTDELYERATAIGSAYDKVLREYDPAGMPTDADGRFEAILPIERRHISPYHQPLL